MKFSAPLVLVASILAVASARPHQKRGFAVTGELAFHLPL